uniref:Uncharacterized protein n=1 Tax=Rhizophora mucronata TaxID=61149 RepID=A0A2P2QGB0_RHIMU
MFINFSFKPTYDFDE